MYKKEYFQLEISLKFVKNNNYSPQFCFPQEKLT